MLLLCDYQTSYDFSTAHEEETQRLGNVPYLRYTEKEHSDIDLYYNELGRQVALPLGNDWTSESLARSILSAIVEGTSHILINDYGYAIADDYSMQK